jgi:hypothetical protein
MGCFPEAMVGQKQRENKRSMLQNIAELYGNKLDALDGETGLVKDFYFNDNRSGVPIGRRPPDPRNIKPK